MSLSRFQKYIWIFKNTFLYQIFGKKIIFFLLNKILPKNYSHNKPKNSENSWQKINPYRVISVVLEGGLAVWEEGIDSQTGGATATTKRILHAEQKRIFVNVNLMYCLAYDYIKNIFFI